jgi:hypothetical protein
MTPQLPAGSQFLTSPAFFGSFFFLISTKYVYKDYYTLRSDAMKPGGKASKFRKYPPSSSSLYLRTETYSSSEMSVPFYQKARCHISADIITVKALRTSLQECLYIFATRGSVVLCRIFFAAPLH